MVFAGHRKREKSVRWHGDGPPIEGDEIGEGNLVANTIDKVVYQYAMPVDEMLEPRMIESIRRFDHQNARARDDGVGRVGSHVPLHYPYPPPR